MSAPRSLTGANGSPRKADGTLPSMCCGPADAFASRSRYAGARMTNGTLSRRRSMMIGRMVRWGGPAILLTALAALTGCGVKNLPQAPGSDRPPVAVVETEASGATLLSDFDHADDRLDARGDRLLRERRQPGRSAAQSERAQRLHPRSLVELTAWTPPFGLASSERSDGCLPFNGEADPIRRASTMSRGAHANRTAKAVASALVLEIR